MKTIVALCLLASLAAPAAESPLDVVWRRLMTEFRSERTGLIYEHCSDGDATRHLPRPDEIAANAPIATGWSTGMEDSVLSGCPLLLAALRRNDADAFAKLYPGLMRCATVAGKPGFLARSISPFDCKSFYWNSSRDQYTLFVYTMWRVYSSAFATEAMKADIRRVLTDIAEYCETCVTEANGYELLRFDGRAGYVAKMWTANPQGPASYDQWGIPTFDGISPHESERLPMIYAAAAAVTGDRRWRELELKYADPALTIAEAGLPPLMPGFALYQMQVSQRLLWECESDPGRKNRYLKLLRSTAALATNCLARAETRLKELDGRLDQPVGDWRTWEREDCSPGGEFNGLPYRKPIRPEDFAKAYDVVREAGEGLVVRALCPGLMLTADEVMRFRMFVRTSGFEQHNSSGLVYPVLAATYLPKGAAPICRVVNEFFPGMSEFSVLKPTSGVTNLVVRLPHPVKVDDSTAWFTVNATKSGNGRFRVWCVLENEQGGEVASVSTWHNGGAYDWFELGSDWTFLRRAPYDPYYPEERRGLKVRELRFEIKGDVGEIYCEPPVLMGGNLFDRSLVATTLTEERTKTTYGAYGDIFTGVYGGDYEATLELRDAFQAKPFLTRTKTFRLKDTTGAARARLTRQGFALPPLKKGYYEYTITRRTLDSGALDGPPRKGFYGVLSSPAADVPREDARLANPLFVPTASNFVFDAPQVTGKIQTPDFSADKLSRPPYRLAYALEEYSARWHRSNASRPACYWRNGAAVSAAGAQVAIDIPVDWDLVRCNRAFTLRMKIFDGRGLRVAESTATVGVKGRDNVYRPKKGAKLTWQEVCARPAIRATGFASVTLPQNDLRAFMDKVRYLGGYNTFLCDGAWSLETEPIKGFRTYDYLERQIATATDAGLDVAIQIGGIHNDPAWAKFEYEPARVNDGRFLAPHYNNISVWADAPANCIKAFMRDTVARYAGVPNLAYWKCWCYEGEGFTHDWFYMWMFGDTVSGYCEPKRRQYRAWLERKYGTVEKLNAAHGSQWASFADVEPPQPDDPLRHRDRLRNPPPVTTAAYADFYRSKREDFQDYWENFVLKTLRPLDPERLFAAYYYPDAEGDDIATKGVFTRNPGFIKHNGGMQGDRFFGYQPFEYARYEGMPGFITEDVLVWNDRVREWDDEVFGALRLAAGGANFFNYSIYQTRAHDVEHEPNDRGKTAFFEAMGREFFPTVRKMRRPPTRLAVYQNNLRNDNYHGHAWPFGDLWYSRYAPEPICGKYLDRLASHYDVIALDSGAESAPEADLDAIAAWVRNGGTLVMTPATLAWTSEELMQHPGADAQNHEAPDRHPNALLDRLGLSLPTAGTWATSVTGRFSAATCDRAAFPTCTNLFFKNAFSPIRKMVNIDGLGYGREFRPDGYSIYDFSAQAYPQAKVLARMDSPRALSGRPAVLELRAGKGRVILLAQYPQIVDVAFWSDLCSYFGVTRDLSFAGAASDADTFLPWTIGYLLEAADGSYMAMTEEMEDRTSYRRTSFPRDETLPYRRRVRLHTLKPGNYRVSEFRLGVRTERGVFSAAQLDRQGLDYAYDHDQQVVAFYLEPVK